MVTFIGILPISTVIYPQGIQDFRNIQGFQGIQGFSGYSQSTEALIAINRGQQKPCIIFIGILPISTGIYPQGIQDVQGFQGIQGI